MSTCLPPPPAAHIRARPGSPSTYLLTYRYSSSLCTAPHRYWQHMQHHCHFGPPTDTTSQAPPRCHNLRSSGVKHCTRPTPRPACALEHDRSDCGCIISSRCCPPAREKGNRAAPSSGTSLQAIDTLYATHLSTSTVKLSKSEATPLESTSTSTQLVSSHCSSPLAL